MYSKIVSILIFLVGFCSTSGHSQSPELGAQVWIEPGHTDKEIDTWFKILGEQEMPVARLFIMWNYIEHERGEWDFSLYDKAFDAAEKYGVKIVATLTSKRKPPHRGDYYQLHVTGVPETRDGLNQSRIYIQKIVDNWKYHPALDSWILTNEAGQGNRPDPLAIEKYRIWLESKYNEIEELNEVWFTDFDSFQEIEYSEKWTEFGYWNWQILHMDWNTFWREHVSWWLGWIRDEVRKVDSATPIHVHSQNVTGNLARMAYDFPAWRNLGNTLGASAHTSWAFGPFERNQFAFGMSYVSDLFAGSSKDMPYWITELQGGTNLYSGGAYPMTPSPEDISQWVWTSFGSGADRIIFWMLNNRLKSFETTEWSMLDFNHNPTEGLKVAGEIAQTINENARFFENADPVRSPITILLSNESMTSELWSRPGDFLGRGQNAHIYSAYGYYEAFSELGVPVQIKFMHDYDWNSDKKGRTAILPHITVISEDQQKGMEYFVENGNTLLMSGLSGLMNEKTEAWVYKDFPFKRFLGADFKDYVFVDEVFQLELQKPALSLPAHLWRGEIENESAEVIGRYKDKITAVEHAYGEGKAIWIPSLLGLGAWIDDNESLTQLVSQLAESQIAELPFKFSGRQESCVLRVLENKGQYVTIVTNGTNESNNCLMDIPANLEPEFLWGHENQLVGNAVNLGARETSVILWQ